MAKRNANSGQNKSSASGMEDASLSPEGVQTGDAGNTGHTGDTGDTSNMNNMGGTNDSGALAMQEGLPDDLPEVFIPEGFSGEAAHSGSGDQGQHGQFNPDEMEFESWMFDAGEGQSSAMPSSSGALTPASAAEPQTAFASGAAGDAVNAGETASPAPQFAFDDAAPNMPTGPLASGGFSAEDAPGEAHAPALGPSSESVIDYIYGASQGLPSEYNTGYGAEQHPDLDANSPVPVGTAPDAGPDNIWNTGNMGGASNTGNVGGAAASGADQYPASAEAWNDQMLSSVSDFSSVLLALQGGSAGGAGGAGGATLEQPVEQPVAPPWQLGDLQQPTPAAPAEATHDPAAFTGTAAEEAAPQAQGAAVDAPDGSDFSWLNSVEPDLGSLGTLTEPPMPEQPQAASMATEAATAGAPVQEAPPPTLGTSQDQTLGVEADSPQSAPPDWVDAAAVDLPPWLMEDNAAQAAASTGSAEAPEGASLAPAASEAPEAIGVPEWQAESPAATDMSPMAPMAAAPDTEGDDMPEVFSLEDIEREHLQTPPRLAASTASAEESLGGQFNPDEMEFESWMFDEGTAAPLPSLPSTSGLVSSVRAMDSAFETPFAAGAGPTPADMEADIYAQMQADSVDAAARLQMGSVDEEEELPFWLADTPAELSQSGPLQQLPAIPAADFPSVNPAASASAAVSEAQTDDGGAEPPSWLQGMETEAPAEKAFDFSELPPIEPFDFSMIQPVQEEEEALGFSTADLSNRLPEGTHDSMVVTANLDVLADLLGKGQTSGPLGAPGQSRDEAIMEQLLNPGGQPSLMPQAASSAPAAPEAPGIESPSAITQDQLDTDRSLDWAALGTSKLTEGSLSSSLDEEPLYLDPTPPVEGRSGHADSPVLDPDVSPFTLDDIGMEEFDDETEFLSTRQLSRADSVANPEPAASAPASASVPAPMLEQPEKLFGDPAQTDPDYWEAPDWMADVMQTGIMEPPRSGALEAAALPTVSPQAPADDEGSLPTQHLLGRSGRSSEYETYEPVPAAAQLAETQDYGQEVMGEPPGAVFRARVSRFRQPQQVAPSEQPEMFAARVPSMTGASQQAPEEVPAHTQYDDYGYSQDMATQRDITRGASLPASEPEVPEAPEVSAGPTSGAAQSGQASSSQLYTSGHLPALEGYHHLQEIVNSRPNDIGARLALAMAYSQSGHIDHALSEFRRILQNRVVPAPMLGLIEDQISEFTIEPASAARYHRLLGDLYMKQGRYEEAIEAYNMIK